MKRIVLLVSLLLYLTGSPCFAKVNVVATLPWIGSIAGELGKDLVNVTTLVKPNQDPHQIEAKPGMILAARKADIIMYNGLDLEAGYLPLLVESSKNPRLQPGKPGNFNCAAFVRVIEKSATVDRSLGDVHPLGNPHYHLSVRNMRTIVAGMAQTLASVDPQNRAHYLANAAAFTARLDEKQRTWGGSGLRGKRFISYHKFFEYLAYEYGFELAGYVEAKPGIPPSAAHIEALINQASQLRLDGILTTAYQSTQAAAFISRKTGVKTIVIPHEVGSTALAKDWFSLMDQVFAALRS